MELSLKNYKSVLTKELLTKAGKRPVRECDETEKGNFIAYVDEGKDTYDVSLTISPNAEITAHNCDCKTAANSFCLHKTSLLLYIDKGLKAGIKNVKKISPSDQLLETANAEELKEWIKDLLLKNPDIELGFIHHFSGKNNPHTAAEVAQLTNDAVKAVIKNKKNADPTELKKIIDLWSNIHKPIIQHYLANLTDNNAFLNFHSIIETANLLQLKISSTSNKVQKYIDGLLQQAAACIIAVHEESAWFAAASFFTSHIMSGKNASRLYYLIHLENIINASSNERKTKLANALAIQYRQLFSPQLINDTRYTEIIFRIVETNNLFARYYDMFKPIVFNNRFNQNLIRLLIENNRLVLARKYCHEQIQQNSREEYNVPYLELLKKIYTIEKDEEKLAKVLTTLLPLNFNFEDFLFISNRITDAEERKKFRTRMLTKARHHTNDRNTAACAFCFKLMETEKKYKKMIDYIESQTPYSIILHYFEPMVLTDKNELLKSILRKDDDFMWHEPTDNDESCFPALAEKMIAHYAADYLKRVIRQGEKDRFYYRRNRFIVYLDEHLEAPVK